MLTMGVVHLGTFFSLLEIFFYQTSQNAVIVDITELHKVLGQDKISKRYFKYNYLAMYTRRVYIYSLLALRRHRDINHR
jgi:hypothetical protein